MSRKREETALQKRVMRELGALYYVVVHRNNVGTATFVDDEGNPHRVEYGTGGEGAPDLLFEVLHEVGPVPVWVALWIELKTETGDLLPSQVAWHAAAAKMHRNAVVARSVEQARYFVEMVREHGRVLR